MVIKGKVYKFDDNINTDDIIPAKYLDSQDPSFLGSKCMENIYHEFAKTIEKGDIIVAGKNFGCGSSREHALWAIKGCGVALIIAVSFARIFYRNAINLGLPILISSDAAKIKEQDRLEVDLAGGFITDTTLGRSFRSESFPDFMQEIIKSGGLINWVKTKKEG